MREKELEREVYMFKISFVVLHYRSVKDTENCISSILDSTKDQEFKIVIVDNGSNDNSGEYLSELYKNDSKINVIISKVNLGFANGNNRGYKFAKNNLNSDFIIVINNDTIFEQVDFVNQIINIYEETQCHILGPDIITPENIHQNPLREKPFTRGQIRKALTKKTMFLTYYSFKKRFHISDKFSPIEKIYNTKSIEYRNSINCIGRKENIVLQGACIIYTPLYIKNEANAFYPGTFMYGEEDILNYLCKRKGYKMLYSSELQMIHLDGISTKKSTQNDLDKNIFYYKNAVKGLKILLKLMDGDKAETF